MEDHQKSISNIIIWKGIEIKIRTKQNTIHDRNRGREQTQNLKFSRSKDTIRKADLKSQKQNHNQAYKPLPVNNPDSIQMGLSKKVDKKTQETVNGSRPGRTPQALIAKKYHKDKAFKAS